MDGSDSFARSSRAAGAVSGAGAAAAAVLILRHRGADIGSGTRAVASQSAFQVPSLLRPTRPSASVSSGLGGVGRVPSHRPAAAAVAAAVAIACPVVARQRWPQHLRQLRQLRRAEPRSRVLEAKAAEAQGAGAEAAAGGAALVAGGPESVLERLWENQRQNINVLALGIIGAVLFGGFVTLNQGTIAGAEWFSCYVIEYSLSVDNLFVFIVIFEYFKVTGEMQSKVLNYGIAGAVVLRFLFIYLGAQLLQQFDFLILFFAAILVYASYQGFASSDDDEEEGIEDSAVYKTLTNVVEISPKMDGDKFFTEVSGRSVATPLFLCLLVIEFSDIVFATDSVPAVLGTTQEPFIAYTSNIFAVFGLRSLFFLLREAMTRFTYLEPAVNLVLGFIGAKIVLDYFQIVEMPVLLSLAIVITILTVGIGLSMQELASESPEEAEEGAEARAD